MGQHGQQRQGGACSSLSFFNIPVVRFVVLSSIRPVLSVIACSDNQFMFHKAALMGKAVCVLWWEGWMQLFCRTLQLAASKYR